MSDENDELKVRRRRKHRSRRDGSRDQSSSSRHRSSSRDHHRRHKSSRGGRSRGTESTKDSPPSALGGTAVVATSDVRMEDVEALDFDPSETKKLLKDDPAFTEETMQENIFSLMYIAPVNTGAFWFALIVSLFQLALPFLALLDLIILNDEEGNYLQLPNNVSIQVRVLAAMVLVLAVVQFWDLMEAVEKLQKGPPPSRSETPPGAKCWKFYLSYTIQMVMGALFQVSVFVFIMQSTTILDIFLNFAALEFITSVDEFAFLFAQRGYVSNPVKRACDHVNEIKILRRKGGRVCRRIQVLFFGVVMLSMYTVLSLQQQSGRFDCEKIEVQFGDGFITILPIFSGMYTFNRKDKAEGRPVYWDDRRGAAFRYCTKGDSTGIFSFANTGYWVFNIILDDVKSVEDMCENFISRSPDTKAYDLLEAPGREWLTKRQLGDSVQYQVDFFQLRCADCEDETCNGQCVNDVCVCGPEQFGINCQFNQPPCKKTDYDRRTKPFTGVGDFYSSRFDLLTKPDGSAFYSYNRPVYTFVHQDGFVDFLINFGRRYFLFDIFAVNIAGAVQALTEPDEGGNQFPIINTSVLVENFTNFHPWYNWIKPLYAEGKIVNQTADQEIYRVPVFVSDPIDVGTQSDSLSPLGLSWQRTNRVTLSKKNYFDLFLRGTGIETVLICSRCSASSPCLNGGTCLPNNRTCDCPLRNDFGDDFMGDFLGDVVYGGTLCELDCTEQGNSENEACAIDFNPWDDDNFGDDDFFFGGGDDDPFRGNGNFGDDDPFNDDPNFGDDDPATPDGGDPAVPNGTPDGAGGDPPNNPTDDDPNAPTDDDPNTPTDDGNPDDPNFPTDDGNPDDPNFPTDDGNPDDPNFPTDDGNPDDPNFPTDDGTPTDDPNFPTDDGTPTDDPNFPTDDGTPTDDDPNTFGDDGGGFDDDAPL
ncbi:unnamed protein product [Cylindrotheca closterium]|uniref:Uncharacterized protein n=1 Tax=Cylindrotheca closterium TaxID=2856 RepID=A0AAD2CKB8_9STRA|nr:unnamed protein product [Cylindrotheca closterium]